MGATRTASGQADPPLEEAEREQPRFRGRHGGAAATEELARECRDAYREHRAPDVAALRRWVRQGAKVQEAELERFSALEWLARSASSVEGGSDERRLGAIREAVELLLESKADPLCDGLGNPTTAFATAVRAANSPGHFEAVLRPLARALEPDASAQSAADRLVAERYARAELDLLLTVADAERDEGDCLPRARELARLIGMSEEDLARRIEEIAERMRGPAEEAPAGPAPYLRAARGGGRGSGKSADEEGAEISAGVVGPHSADWTSLSTRSTTPPSDDS